MLDQIYNRRLLELAANIPRLGRLADADASATKRSKLCGSIVTVDLKLHGDVVADFAHEVRACALGQASSSIMASKVIGSTVAELRAVQEQARRILKEDGRAPEGKWADLAVLEPLKDFTARHASILLTFEAVVDAIEQIEAQRRSEAS
ncbi:iron-sulfur cluster assembly scaffold protein [Microvirga sp. 2MCAF38]|uniref:iron-sulfur cluster assembly scaffold protein n=1 Tax=Microvirga sp. 2MCAF38 TaxID=3232989 RepID=UPI003F9DB4B5